MRRFSLVCLYAVGAAAAGCGGGDPMPQVPDGGTFYRCEAETRAPPYMPGMSETSRQGMFTAKLLQSQPGPPSKGNNAWTVQILDSAGTPADGVAMKATPFMPDHAHGTGVKAVVTPTGSDGTYEITPLYLFMAGYWEVTLNLQTGTARDDVVFPVCISG
jgi:YtkA-like